MNRVKNSVGIWSFGANATRFMPSGYHPQAGREDMHAKVRRVVDGLGELVDGYEFHYPGEVNEDNVEKVKKALGSADLYCIALGIFNDPKYALGSFINPEKKLRNEAIEITKKGIELAAATGAKFIIWPGGEGYNYSLLTVGRGGPGKKMDSFTSFAGTECDTMRSLVNSGEA